MSIINTLLNTDNGADSMADINTNFSNLNADKLEATDIIGKLNLDQTTPQTISVGQPIQDVLTASELVATDASKKLSSLPVATYPSLAELAYCKGVTSAIQDQIDGKAPSLGADDNYVTDDEKIVIGNTSGTNTGDQTLPVKATGTELDTGTNDVKFATALAIKNAKNVPSVAPSTDGNVLTSDGTNWVSEAPSAGGTSLWTAITATRVSGTTATVVGDQTDIFKKGMIVRWQESAVDKVAMVSIPSTYSDPNTTITFIGDTMASIDADSFKYSGIIGAEQFVKDFAYAGTVGATGSDIMNAYYATEPMRVIGADLQVGIAGTTNSTTIDINKGGTTMFTTKPTLATTVASSPLPFTANTISALALGDKVTIDIDAVQTTKAVDLYVQLYLLPSRYLTLE